jgi:hypothetical protein
VARHVRSDYREGVNEFRNEVIEFIEIAIVELRAMAQPREIAELRELAMDARDADALEQLESILAQAKNLREFCEKRTRSTGNFPKTVPPPRR